MLSDAQSLCGWGFVIFFYSYTPLVSVQSSTESLKKVFLAL